MSRVIDLLLAASGLGFTVFGSGSDRVRAIFLLVWGLFAFGYLLVGGLFVRRQRNRDVPLPPVSRLHRWLSFFVTIAASMTGLGASLDVLSGNRATGFSAVITGLAVLVMLCAWALLHLGYARFYGHFRQWRFPGTQEPQFIDFLYFSFTVGCSFATSDVELRSRDLRWHVMVHTVLSFFYNAIVLASAVGVITNS